MAGSTGERITKIIAFLTETGGSALVPVRVVREALDYPADFDQAMTAMYCSQRVNLIPQSFQQGLTAADRAAAVRVGRESKHLVSLG